MISFLPWIFTLNSTHTLEYSHCYDHNEMTSFSMVMMVNTNSILNINNT